ncbi:MAG: hypothetical protein V7717_08695 [Porticoccaceae bacterium]
MSKIRAPAWSGVLCLAMTGCVPTGASSFYFLGLNHHAKPTPRTVEGNMHYVGYSREYEKDNWDFENGVNTYVDSYGQQSYTIFSRVSHDSYKTKYVVPEVSLNCSYKGRN